MSNTDSFIEEVTEEVRRDRLFILLKKWGWLGGLAVLLLVGGAAFNEYRKSSARSAAEAFGDSLLAGIEADDQGASLSALSPEDASRAALARHLAAADALEGDATDTALTELGKAVELGDAPAIYRDLAQFKLALAMPQDDPSADRIAAFEQLTTPGAPFRLLAQEQIALIAISQGDTDAAITQLLELFEDAEATIGLQQRASELIVALGSELPE